jgi:hypothetical protein
MTHNIQERILDMAVEGTALRYTWELWNNHETHQWLSANNNIFDHMVTTAKKAAMKLGREGGKRPLWACVSHLSGETSLLCCTELQNASKIQSDTTQLMILVRYILTLILSPVCFGSGYEPSSGWLLFLGKAKYTISNAIVILPY